MADAIEFLSNNLSGKTVNFVFLPQTGGTIQLGSDIFPYSYLSGDFSGTFQFYVPELDYTYSIDLTTPVNSYKQTVSFVSTTTGDTSLWVILILDTTTGVGTFIETNLSTNDWNSGYHEITNEQGYSFYFYAYIDNQYYRYYFITDSNSNLLGSYSAQTSNTTTYGGPVAWVLIDYTNGVVFYRDNFDVYTYNYDINRYSEVYPQWNYDWHTSDGAFIIEQYDNVDDLYRIILFKQNTQIELFTDPILNKNLNYDMSFGSSFIVIREYDYNTGTNTYLKIYSSDGQQLHYLDLTLYGVGDYDYDFYGDNKYYFFGYYNSYEQMIMVSYDGNSNTLITTTKDISNFPNWSIKSVNRFDSNNNTGDENLFVSFYNTNNNQIFNYSLYYVSYCDIVYLRDGDTQFQTYTINDTGSGNIYAGVFYNEQHSGDSFYIGVSEDSVNYDILVISPTGTTSLYMGDNSTIDYIEFNDFGRKCYLRKNNQNGTAEHIILSEYGNILGNIMTNISYYNYGAITEWESIFIFNYITNEFYGYSPGTNGFQSITGMTWNGSLHSSYSNYYTFYNPPYFNCEGNIIIYNNTEQKGVMISNSGISSIIELQSVSYIYPTIHKSFSILPYQDPLDFTYKINYYDLSGNLIQSVVDPGFYVGNWSVKDRKWFYSVNGGVNTITVITDNGDVVTTSISDWNTNYYINDYMWNWY